MAIITDSVKTASPAAPTKVRPERPQKPTPPPPVRWQNASIDGPLALAVPAVRIFALVAYSQADATDGGPAVDIVVHPVLAIESVRRDKYCRRVDDGYFEKVPWPTPQGMEAAGFLLQESGIERSVLIADNPYGQDSIVTLEEATEGVSNYLGHRLIPCSWPEAEDAGRLATIADKYRAELTQRVRGGRT